MIPKIIHAEYKSNFVVYIRFSDGSEGDIDLKNELYGEMFEPLKDPALFSQVEVHRDFHTLCWPNGADIAPEFLYEKIRVPA